ncbi:hypothetical protein AAHE18_06G139200 [Arachis hypogaea]
MLSMRIFRSWKPSLVTSTSPWTTSPLSRTCLSTPFLIRSNVGSLSMAAQVRCCSSSSCMWRLLRPNTSGSAAAVQTSLKLAEVKLRRPLVDMAKSSPVINADAIFGLASFLLKRIQH